MFTEQALNSVHVVAIKVIGPRGPVALGDFLLQTLLLEQPYRVAGVWVCEGRATLLALTVALQDPISSSKTQKALKSSIVWVLF